MYIEGCLKVGSEIGQWKVEDNKHIDFPSDEYKYRYNEYYQS